MSAPAAAASSTEQTSTTTTQQQKPSVKKDFIVEIEKSVQERWNKSKPYNAEVNKNKPKYMITFPYPYMNGRLHLGHGFSFSKCEFAARFQRMKGKNVLWGFGLHVTGTPIAACAQKLRNEMAKYGNPPKFPEVSEEEQQAAQQKKEDDKKKDAANKDLSKHQGKRAKIGPAKAQWQIMQGMGLSDADIPAFADPMKWLDYFPPLALRDCRHMGCHIDYRRSFITTDVNPFYDSFVRWQFEILQKKGYLGFGERYCIYTTVDKQPCADHDRASGEGVPPQEYIIVKLEVQNAKSHPAFAPFADKIADRKVILPGATLRAETVVGQTNCWVSPTVTYKAYEVVPILSPAELRRQGKDPEAIIPKNPDAPKEIFITTARCAHNLAYQNYLVNGVTRAEPEPLFEIEGENLIGTGVSAPYAPFSTIYALPMSTISDTKGTAIVMSVPSDSPDDWINFTTLVKKADYRAKLNLKDEWVLPFNIVPIIDIPGELGNNSAELACAKFKVTGAKDADALAQAKELCYSEGFYKGTMTIGPFKGEKVMEAKKLMAAKMVGEGSALIYQEPQKQVINRSGDECVVALCDQWFLTYSNEAWKAPVREHVKNKLDTFTFAGVKGGLVETVDWLSEWPCSRNFGLGTQMPGAKPEDGKVIIDSLSDSTIYMAYYTVAKYLHASDDAAAPEDVLNDNVPTSDALNLNGRRPNKYGIKPEHMTSEAWDFILLNKGTAESVHASTGLPIEAANLMREEFNYFYPCDLRTSGKDLIQNHLTMALFNHAAIWENDASKWLQGIYCNGHILVDNAKMSKSAGNFIILKDALEEYTADGTRLAFAEAGDSMNDANFVRASASDHILRLHALIDAFKSRQSKLDSYRTGEKNLFDKMFENTINTTIQKADYFYDRMLFQKAMTLIYFELTSEITQYELLCGNASLHRDVVVFLNSVLPRLLMPLCPHTCEYLWMDVLGNTTSINDAAWPTISSVGIDATYAFATKLIFDVAAEIRAGITKFQKKKVTPKVAYVLTREAYLPWQVSGLTLLQQILKDNGGVEFPKDTTKMITSRKDLDWLDAKMMPDIMGFLSFQKTSSEKYGEKALDTTPPIQDAEVLTAATEFLTRQTGIASIVIVKMDAASPNEAVEKAKEKARPLMPAFHFEA